MGALGEFLKNNLGTIAVTLVLAVIIAAVAVRLIKNRKAGKSSCGCGCSTCPMSGKCHEAAEKK